MTHEPKTMLVSMGLICNTIPKTPRGESRGGFGLHKLSRKKKKET